MKNFQVAATIDEGNNYVNLKFGPLYLSNPTVATGAVFGNYHLAGTTSSAYNTGTATSAPNHDYDGQARPGPTNSTLYDIGADEYWPATATSQPPTLPY